MSATRPGVVIGAVPAVIQALPDAFGPGARPAAAMSSPYRTRGDPNGPDPSTPSYH